MRIEKTDRAPIFVFESQAEALREAEKGPIYDPSYRYDWVGKEVDTWDKLHEAVNTSHEDTCKMFEECKFEIDAVQLPDVKCRKPKLRWDEENGDEICIDKMRAGDPFFRRMVREDSHGIGEVTIVVGVDGSAYYSAQELLWRGVAAVALAEKLELNGYSVTIWAVVGTSNVTVNNEDHSWAINLKNGSDPLDVVTLSNTLSGWYFRSALFTLMGNTLSEIGKTITQGKGRPRTLTRKEIRGFTPDENVIHIAGLYSKYDAVELMKSELQNIMTPKQ